MKKVLMLLSMLMMFGTFVSIAAPGPAPAGDSVEKAIVLCGGCGEVKAGEKCCKAEAAKCGGCELHKGSPGCCKMAKGKDAKLCGHCGEVAGGDKCCKPEGREKCGGCNTLKGSAACKVKCAG